MGATTHVDLEKVLAELSFGVRLRIALDILERASEEGAAIARRSATSRMRIERIVTDADGVAMLRGEGDASGAIELAWEVLAASSTAGGAAEALDDAPEPIVLAMQTALRGEGPVGVFFDALDAASRGHVDTHDDVRRALDRLLDDGAATLEHLAPRAAELAPEVVSAALAPEPAAPVEAPPPVVQLAVEAPPPVVHVAVEAPKLAPVASAITRAPSRGPAVRVARPMNASPPARAPLPVRPRAQPAHPPPSSNSSVAKPTTPRVEPLPDAGPRTAPKADEEPVTPRVPFVRSDSDDARPAAACADLLPAPAALLPLTPLTQGTGPHVVPTRQTLLGLGQTARRDAPAPRLAGAAAPPPRAVRQIHPPEPRPGPPPPPPEPVIAAVIASGDPARSRRAQRDGVTGDAPTALVRRVLMRRKKGYAWVEVALAAAVLAGAVLLAIALAGAGPP